MKELTKNIIENELRLKTDKVHLNIKQISELLDIDQHIAAKMMKPYQYFPGRGHYYIIPQIAEAYINYSKPDKNKGVNTNEPMIKVQRASRRKIA